jgi:hypothetical protein
MAKKEKPWYFYVYATGHGTPSSFRLILHVGYSQSNQNTYPTWYSEGVSLETAQKIDEKVSQWDHTDWSTSTAQWLQNKITNYIQMAKEGKL